MSMPLWEVNAYLLQWQDVKFRANMNVLPAEDEFSGVREHGLSLLLISDPATVT